MLGAPEQAVFDKLAAKLDVAFCTITAELSPQEERRRYILAIQAIIEFLDAFNFPMEHTLSLAALMARFSDLDRGSRPALFIPEQTATRPPDLSTLWIKRALVCIILNLFVEMGHQRTSASVAIAKAHPVLQKLFGKPKSLSKRILSMDDDFRGGKIKEPHATHIYNTNLPRAHARLMEAPEAEREARLHSWLAAIAASDAQVFPPL
jgi:hypothetical protein